MYTTPAWENKPRQGEQGEQDLLHPEGAYFRYWPVTFYTLSRLLRDYLPKTKK